MITLAALKTYAENHATERFPLGSCSSCLAAMMYGQPMMGYESYEDGNTVDPLWAEFTRRYTMDKWVERNKVNYHPTGANIAEAITEMLAGEPPQSAADRAFARRND